jgi:hypothetical protein
MKKTTIMGFIAFSSTIAYIYLLRKDKEENSGVEGIEIKINPEKIVDGALAMSNINPMAKDGIRRIARNAINRYYSDID